MIGKGIGGVVGCSVGKVLGKKRRARNKLKAELVSARAKIT